MGVGGYGWVDLSYPQAFMGLFYSNIICDANYSVKSMT
jgi:hypothetical protein